jgi:predicted RNA-binding Zn-ribbon protein involved in translation (DUF1610 family)
VAGVTEFSNWDDANRRRVEVDLVCPKCGQANQPRAISIRLTDEWQAECHTCAFAWPVRRIPRED